MQFSYQRSCRGRRVRSQRCTWAWRCRRRSQLCFHTQSLRRSCGFAKHIHQRLQGNTDKRTEWLETSCCHVVMLAGREDGLSAAKACLSLGLLALALPLTAAVGGAVPQDQDEYVASPKFIVSASRSSRVEKRNSIPIKYLLFQGSN